MKENYEKFKVFWDNRRYRSSIILAFYIIFFAFVLVFFIPKDLEIAERILEDENIEEEVEIEGFTLEKRNYSYLLKVLYDEEEYDYEIEYIDGELIEIEIDEDLEKALVFNNYLIERMVNDANLTRENTDYLENITETVYNLNEEGFYDIFLEENNEINIILIYKDEKLAEIELIFRETYENIENIIIEYLEEQQ